MPEITIESLERSISDLSYVHATDRLDDFSDSAVIDAVELLIAVRDEILQAKERKNQDV